MSLCIFTHKYTDKDIHILTQIHTHTEQDPQFQWPSHPCLYKLFVYSVCCLTSYLYL